MNVVNVILIHTGFSAGPWSDVMNVMNVGERLKSATFTTYPHESKGLVNVVNVSRGFFAISRMSFAKRFRTGDKKLISVEISSRL